MVGTLFQNNAGLPNYTDYQWELLQYAFLPITFESLNCSQTFEVATLPHRTETDERNALPLTFPCHAQ
jgi:hypothetical protein